MLPLSFAPSFIIQHKVFGCECKINLTSVCMGSYDNKNILFIKCIFQTVCSKAHTKVEFQTK